MKKINEKFLLQNQPKPHMGNIDMKIKKVVSKYLTLIALPLFILLFSSTSATANKFLTYQDLQQTVVSLANPSYQGPKQGAIIIAVYVNSDGVGDYYHFRGFFKRN